MNIRQAVLGAGVAAALVFGAGAGPVHSASALSGIPACGVSVREAGDRVFTRLLDVLGEIEARVRHF